MREVYRRAFLVEGLAAIAAACARGAQSAQDLRPPDGTGDPKPPPNPTVRPPEQEVEQGWPLYSSANFPYQMNYPAHWTVMTGYNGEDVYVGDAASDGFVTNVRINGSVVNPWVKTESWKDQMIAAIKTTLPTVQIRENSHSINIDGLNIAGFTYLRPPILTPPLLPFEQVFAPHYITALTGVKDGRGWVVAFWRSAKDADALGDKGFETFRKMMNFFKFRSGK